MDRPSVRAFAPSRSAVRIAPLAAGFLAFVVLGTAVAADEGVKLETTLQRLSYAIGLQIGQSLRGQGLERIDAAALALALDDVLQQREPRLTAADIQAAQQEYLASRAQEQSGRAADNLAAGRAFLDSNAENEGVVETAVGVQYRILRAGEGPMPGAEDTVVVHYRGRLLDGTEFDSSYQRGQPAEFTVGGVIQGWQLALQAMPAGSHWEVWIPSALAYGERGAGGAIGPNQTLHFEIELIEVKPSG